MRLRWSKLAIGDLREVREFIALDNPQAATSVVARVRRSANRIAAFPGSGVPLGVASLRATTVPVTPFRIVYRIDGDTVVIVAVRHGARQWPPASF